MKVIYLTMTLLFVPLTCFAADNTQKAKELSGISIVGNKEAPKALYIVPWKSSEIGIETNLTSGLMDETLRPVDKEVFQRQLNYYDAAQNIK